MPKLAATIFLATSVFTLSATANAEIRILKCDGPTFKNIMHELPRKSFYFKLDDKSGSVTWAMYDDIKDIKVLIFDDSRLQFVATRGDISNPYSGITSYNFFVSRISGQGAVDISIGQNHKLQLMSVYPVDCHIVGKAF